LFCHLVANGHTAFISQREEIGQCCRELLQSDVGDSVGEVNEVVVAGNEVSFAVQRDNDTFRVVGVGFGNNNTFPGFTVFAFRSLGDTFLRSQS